MKSSQTKSNNSQKRKSSGSTLVCTLGSEPQVVTATLDLLLRRGEEVNETVVVHTCPNEGIIQQAVDVLKLDFETHPYPHPAAFRLVPIVMNGRTFTDVRTPQANTAAFQCLYEVLYPIKKAGERVHLCIAGGRKNMAIYGMTAAQMLFDENDHLWHLYSEGDFLASKRLHPQVGEPVELVEIPVLLRDYISPALTGLKGIDNAEEALAHMRRLDFEKRLADLRSFVYNDLTHAERRVVTLLVQEGLSDQEIARRLSNSPRTIERHLRSAYSRAAQKWGLESVSRTQLVSLLSLYGTFLSDEEYKK